MKFLIFLSLFSARVLTRGVNVLSPHNVDPPHDVASQHTGCYRYMLGKYECVPSADKKRCHVPGFETKEVSKFPGRGFHTTIPTQPVAGGDGICGKYNSNTTLGVCLWSGSNPADGSDPNTSGWLNGGLKTNCGKFVYVQRKGKPQTIQYARVLDGCSLNIHDPKEGCFQMYMTTALFNKFKPSKKDFEKGNIEDSFTWGFDNEFGQHAFNAPV